jgi:hypothetical protein
MTGDGFTAEPVTITVDASQNLGDIPEVFRAGLRVGRVY